MQPLGLARLFIGLFCVFYTFLDILQHLTTLHYGSFEKLGMMSFVYALIMTATLTMIRVWRSKRA
ncbi:MAG TPA: hypothetical protein VJS90_10860 [Pseudomonas sp.]|uniref:hypothetical protein n=1 Tax=Pseudomonas sp. TaxID=306 RepID=UPI002B470BAF|nr:hypothetical protein [Pseudomonas sp.]HKS13525.1 hypothetical protein [Pseudomonas sp.]